MVHSYKELIVWQKAIKLVVLVYALTKNFPREEIYRLTSQIRRAAVSIPANIAEGRMRSTRKDYANFLHTAYASGGELETHLEIARQLPETSKLYYTEVEQLLDEVMRMLNSMITKLFPKANQLSS